jgi:thioredoxin 1
MRSISLPEAFQHLLYHVSKDEVKVMIKVLDEKSFEQTIAKGKVMVDFWASWCGPCTTLAPTIEEVAREVDDVVIGKVDVDEYPELAGKHGVMSIPTLMFFKDGKLIDSSVGVVSKSIIMKKLERLAE